MAREIFMRRRNRNFPRKRICSCCKLLCSAKHEDDLQYLVHDKYAIALINSESVTVGHLPKFKSKLAHFFVKHAGKIRCEFTGSKRYSSDLEQGGNERIIEEMKRKLPPLIEKYNNKKH